jgi:two-component system NtrC family sensor kinase
MKSSIYASLQRKIISITLVVSFAPLLLLGGTIYYQFDRMFKDKIEEQMRYRARAQAEAVDLFLKERTAILSAMADTHSFQDLKQEENLSNVFQVINLRAGAFVDLGVIDSSGEHVAYVGPYDLRGLNYDQQPWFAEAMSKGLYISDVYMGFRRLPHFVIAVRRQENQQIWILRATVDPEIFGSIVRSAQLGKTGDAYILNKEGVYQTQPRFDGDILSEATLNTTLFGRSTTVNKEVNGHGRRLFYAGSWLKNNDWLLIISQDPAEEMGGLFATRNVEIAIILGGIVAIVLMTVFTTRLTVTRLRQADMRMNELNAQLVQSDKLTALGKMAVGVAHEINNPLAVIQQKIGWMEDLLAEETFEKSRHLEEYISSIQKIDEHVERVRKIVHNMLGFVRRMEPHLEDVDINATLNQTIALLENSARINNIEIRTDLAPELPIIAGDQAQLQQVFMNLISNAIDAVEKDGLIQVESRQTDSSHITVNIIDNGPGIPEKEQRKIFDPFFTTKSAEGKGTGLGLWVSHNIMEKMGGNITFSSREGNGCTFFVTIPAIIPEKK